jgi:hypothetical protein
VDEIIPLSPGELMNTGAEPLLDREKRFSIPFYVHRYVLHEGEI